MSPYQIAFGKACHLRVEIKHKAYWVVKQCNLTYDQAWKQRKFQLQELDELRLEERVLSWPESTSIHFTFKAHRRYLLYD
ncbi:hypothetical protein CR513_48939, partial [Mucuna pruriens]